MIGHNIFVPEAIPTRIETRRETHRKAQPELASLTKEAEADGGEKGGVEGSEGNIFYWKRLAELRKAQRRATGEARAKLWYAQRRGRNKHVAEKDEPIAERRAGHERREPKEANAVPQPLTVLKSIRTAVFLTFAPKMSKLIGKVGKCESKN